MGMIDLLKRLYGSNESPSLSSALPTKEGGYITAVYQEDGTAVIVHDSLSDPVAGMHGDLRYGTYSPCDPPVLDSTVWLDEPPLVAERNEDDLGCDPNNEFDPIGSAYCDHTHEMSPLFRPSLFDHDSTFENASVGIGHLGGINPSTGLQMMECGVDAGGNIFGADSSWDCDSFGPGRINPSTGLPMMDGCLDVGGNIFGTNSSFGLCSTSDSVFGNTFSSGCDSGFSSTSGPDLDISSSFSSGTGSDW